MKLPFQLNRRWKLAFCASGGLAFLAGIILYSLIGNKLGVAQTEEEKPAVAVAVETAELRDLRRTFEANTFLFPWKEATLKANQGATVRDVLVKVGDTVKVGSVLARTDSEAQALKTELDKIDFEIKNMDFQVTAALARKNFLSANEMKQKELEFRAQKVKARLVELDTNKALRSPIAGIVAEINMKPGDYVDGNSNAFIKVVDTEKFRLMVFLPQTIVQNIGLGDGVEVAVSYDKNRKAVGLVSSIAPAIDIKTGSVQVEVTVKRSDLSEKAGTPVIASFITEKADGALTISQTSVVEEKEKTFVYRIVSTPKDVTPERELAAAPSFETVEKIEVKLGMKEDGFFQVQAGLGDLDQIVRRGQSFLRHGSKVDIVE